MNAPLGPSGGCTLGPRLSLHALVLGLKLTSSHVNLCLCAAQVLATVDDLYHLLTLLSSARLAVQVLATVEVDASTPTHPCCLCSGLCRCWLQLRPWM